MSQDSTDWELHHIRDAIASDWQALASNKLSSHQRRSVREHLSMNIAALRDIMTRRRKELVVRLRPRTARRVIDNKPSGLLPWDNG
jgi:hypothetical protein